MPTLTGRSPYLAKDQAKSDKANKFIGEGSYKSSTKSYKECWGDLANCGYYESTDVVFISAEGFRVKRISPNFDEIRLAAEAGVTFITDNKDNRYRTYNIGEREVADFLFDIGYTEVRGNGVWTR